MFTLAVRGPLCAEDTDGGLSVHLRDAQGNKVLHYPGLIVYDADHKTLPARTQISNGQLHISIAEEDARYPLTIDPIAQQAYVKASNTNTGDEFGRAVAVSGNTVVVGARSEDSNSTGVNGNQDDNTSGNSGTVYVFVRNGANWSQEAYLKAPNTEAVHWFGRSVAISEDTIVVGAPAAAPSGRRSRCFGVPGPNAR